MTFFIDAHHSTSYYFIITISWIIIYSLLISFLDSDFIDIDRYRSNRRFSYFIVTFGLKDKFHLQYRSFVWTFDKMNFRLRMIDQPCHDTFSWRRRVASTTQLCHCIVTVQYIYYIYTYYMCTPYPPFSSTFFSFFSSYMCIKYIGYLYMYRERASVTDNKINEKKKKKF